MQMQIDETGQRAGAAPVYSPIARLRRKIPIWQQARNQAVAQDEGVPGDKSVLLPNAAVLDQYAGH